MPALLRNALRNVFFSATALAVEMLCANSTDCLEVCQRIGCSIYTCENFPGIKNTCHLRISKSFSHAIFAIGQREIRATSLLSWNDQSGQESGHH